ncbi:MAG: hypothetical protein LBN33_09885 [Desulfovibrio sp.]|jgi:hypothetical protein|nr:hypothetical protein [Desulfovibrio sp.]
MRKEKFRAWLCRVKGLQASTAGSRISNCERIESFEGNLDELFEQDRLDGLLKKLSYSKQDQRQYTLSRHAIPIDGDVYNGTATLRSAARLYQEFAGSWTIATGTPSVESSLKKRVKTTGDWPTWDTPSSDTVLALTKMVTPYVRFLHPSVVEQVVEDNERNRQQWREKLISKSIDPDYYLWDKSSCAFPGIRRYTGSKEIAHYRNQLGQPELEIPDAFRLDDNSFPKHIWSFIFRGKVFQNFGPEGYSLAHLADHKDYKNRRDDEFDAAGVTPGKLYGLYSCTSNTIYMPTTLLKLTDFNKQARLLLLHKAQSLYGKFCNLLPPAFQLKPQSLHDWHVDNFDWCEPVGANAALDGFFQFRSATIDSL